EVFSNPKPVSLIQHLIDIVVDSPDDYVLDFFSGSGTTAQAVMNFNAENNSSLRFICAQLHEDVNSGKEPGRNAISLGYEAIDEVAVERIKRAAAKIKKSSQADIDYGFKLFRVEKPAQQSLDEIEKFEASDPDL